MRPAEIRGTTNVEQLLLLGPIVNRTWIVTVNVPSNALEFSFSHATFLHNVVMRKNEECHQRSKNLPLPLSGEGARVRAGTLLCFELWLLACVCHQRARAVGPGARGAPTVIVRMPQLGPPPFCTLFVQVVICIDSSEGGNENA